MLIPTFDHGRSGKGARWSGIEKALILFFGRLTDARGMNNLFRTVAHFWAQVQLPESCKSPNYSEMCLMRLEDERSLQYMGYHKPLTAQENAVIPGKAIPHAVEK